MLGILNIAFNILMFLYEIYISYLGAKGAYAAWRRPTHVMTLLTTPILKINIFHHNYLPSS